MKRFLIYLVLSFTITIVSYKQTIAQESACHRDWGFWQNLYTPMANTNFRISFKLPKSNDEACQTIYYRFQNLYAIPEAYLMFKVEYKTSDNRIKTESFSYVKLDKTGVITDPGNFFVGNQVIRVYDVVYKELPGKKKKDEELIPASSNERTKALLNNSSQPKVPSGTRAPDSGRRADNNSSSTTESVALTNNSQNQSNPKDDKISENKSSTNKNSSSDATKSKSNSSTSSYYKGQEQAIEMEQRATIQRKKDENEDKAMSAAIVGTVGLMGYISERNMSSNFDNETPIYLNGFLGLGFQSIPIVANLNTNNNFSSNTETTNHLSINGGLLFALFNDRFVNFQLSPFATYGMNAFDYGKTGSHLSYGSSAGLGFGRAFKLLLKGEFAHRSGDITEDDAVAGVNSKGFSSYNYSTYKYGLGAYYSIEDYTFEISAYKENISFLKSLKTEVYSYEAKISSFISIAVQYSPNYPIAGIVKYPGTIKKDKQDFMTISVYVPFRIFSID